MTMNLAEIARTLRPSLTRKELKVVRAKMRRAGVAGLSKTVRGPYTVNTSADVASDARAEQGTIVAQVAAMIVAK